MKGKRTLLNYCGLLGVVERFQRVRRDGLQRGAGATSVLGERAGGAE